MIPRDVEGEFIAALAPLGVPVRTRVPNPRPPSHVRVTRTGGDGVNLVQERPVVLVECWAPSSTAAFDLAARAYGLVDAAFCGPRDRPSSPVNFPDPATDASRYQFVVSPIVNLKEPA